MNNAWFNPMLYGWIPGTFIGVMGGVEGVLIGILASKGKAKKFIFTFHFSLIGISLLLLISGIIALISKQPYGVWYGLSLAGMIGTIVLGSLTPVVLRRFKEAEMRKTMSQDI
ncbi:MAG: hypothetical protein K8S23_16655 [Candidatus Cloacimonetes bacterium]|nr:hypothetical protein [Candidatus Cloacimonadota bacterium]